MPVLIDDDGVIIAGHGRYDAAVLLGLQEVPVIRVAGLSQAKRRALAPGAVPPTTSMPTHPPKTAIGASQQANETTPGVFSHRRLTARARWADPPKKIIGGRARSSRA